MTRNNNNRSAWLEQMAAAEREYGGLMLGPLRPPDAPPSPPVEEDEATLRRILKEKAEQMRQKQAKREKAAATEPVA